MNRKNKSAIVRELKVPVVSHLIGSEQETFILIDARNAFTCKNQGQGNSVPGYTVFRVIYT
jgi:hypothetical protein